MTNATDALRARLQKQCVDWDAYWREPDAHGVILSPEQATELLADALGVEVEITATPAGSASGEDGLGARADRLIRLAQANEKIEALQAEVAQLRGKVSERHCQVINSDAQVAEQRERAEAAEAEAARLRELLRRAQPCVRHTAGNVAQRLGMDYAKSDYELLAAIDAAMGSANGQG